MQTSQLGATAIAREPRKVVYEQPLNERIRTFLRLEFLFRKVHHDLKGKTRWDSREALAGILEILCIASRSDLKTEVMKELERHTANLARLEQNPGVDRARLSRILDELERLTDALYAIDGKLGDELRRNDFLAGIRQRSAIPGGTCDFDLPAYHYWLERPAEERLRDLQAWLGAFEVIQRAVDMILRLTRDCALPSKEIAQGGFYQKTLDANLPCQIVRVALPADASCYAEISGGRHRISIRFMEHRAMEGRPIQTKQDVPFELTCCII